MNTWIGENSLMLLLVLASATLVSLTAAVVLLVAWLRARSARKRQTLDRVSAERERINLELSLAEQTGRLRIIREMHEVAVLSVAGIIAAAEGARYAAAADPAVAARSAGQIADLARTTLGDLRRVMTVVREGEADAAPQPRLKSARDLFKVMRDAGLVVAFEEIGERYRLAPGAELAVYRILQEALSNSLKYGGEGTEARVVFTWTADGLQLKVDDDGARAQLKRRGLDPNDPANQHSYSIEEDLSALTGVVEGVGITEMRERARAVRWCVHGDAGTWRRILGIRRLPAPQISQRGSRREPRPVKGALIREEGDSVAVKEAVAVGVAVSAYGVSFGALSVAAGLDIWQTCVLSLLMFSGGSQFAFIGVLAAGGVAAGPAAVASAALLGARNGIYAMRLSPVVGRPWWRKALAAHITIDESMAVSTAQERPRAQRIGFWVTGILIFLGWNLTTPNWGDHR